MKIVSIIIPMYNVAHYLPQCVASIFAQDLRATDFEIIMVNDGSPDNSFDIATDIAKKHLNIKVISQDNKGLGGARNTGVANANGKYILFLDADDQFVPKSLQTIIRLAEKHSLDILEYGFHQINEDGTIQNTIAIENENIFNGIDYYNTIKYAGSACNKLYRTTFLQTNQLFFLEKIYGEDFEFNTRAYFFAQKVMATNQIVSLFLQSANSITRNTTIATKDKYLNDYLKILSSIKTFYLLNGNSADIRESTYFMERLSLVNINAFYMMFKNNYSFKAIINYRETLKNNALLYVDTPVTNKSKNLFRKVMLQHFFLFNLSQPLKKLFKK